MSCPVATSVQFRSRCFGPRCNSVCWKTMFWQKRGSWAFWRTTDQDVTQRHGLWALNVSGMLGSWVPVGLQVLSLTLEPVARGEAANQRGWLLLGQPGQQLKNSFEKCFFFFCIGRQDGNAWKCGFLVIIQWSRGPPSTFQWTVAGHLLCSSHQRVASCAGELSPLGSMSKNGCFKHLHFVSNFEVHLVRGFWWILSLWLERNLETQIISRLWSRLTWCYNRCIDVKVGQPFGTKPWIVQASFWISVVCWDGRGCRRYPWSSIILNHIQIASIIWNHMSYMLYHILITSIEVAVYRLIWFRYGPFSCFL